MGIIGIANPLNKGIYRNMLCPCGSGKKTKKCHGQNLVITQEQYDHIMGMEEKRSMEFNQALTEQMEKSGFKIEDGVYAPEKTT